MGAQLLQAGFLRSAETFPDRPAVVVDGETWTFAQLRRRAGSMAATLQRRTPAGGPPLVAVYAHRSPTAYAGVLSALLAGCGYVPLNRTFPVARTRAMLQSAGCRAVIVDARSEAHLDALLGGVEAPLLLMFPDRRDVTQFRDRWPDHIVVGTGDLEDFGKLAPSDPDAGSLAYLLFTSGSTGTPKGVMVSHRNVRHFVEWIARRYAIGPEDRFSQMFDLTFDLAVFDIFGAWERGACVCCPAGNDLLNPARFLREQGVTVWGAVPSVGVIMKRLGALKPGVFPALRASMFCGEALPADIAESWQKAAPGSVVDNLYGPTELTVACAAYTWESELSPAECEMGIVPIGAPLPGMRAIVVDGQLHEVEAGEAGELLMAGPQVTPGYWNDADATRRGYVVPPGQRDMFYRTGDRVRRPAGMGPITYLGRMDTQIKVRGYRVELGEIEACLREEPGVDAAVAVGWPLEVSGAGGVVAFVSGRLLEPAAMRGRLREKLQAHAVPGAIHVLPELPRNQNGKIDRAALVRTLGA